MIARTRVEVTEGLGIRDDRYGLRNGSQSARGKTPHHKKHNVTFIDSASIQKAKKRMAKESRAGFSPHETRRNILVSYPDVHELVGKLFRVGTVEFLGIAQTIACARPGKLCGKTNFLKAFFGIGGLTAEALTSGQIKVGDPIVLLE
jgi:MOSC domain-containing protein YiiM